MGYDEELPNQPPTEEAQTKDESPTTTAGVPTTSNAGTGSPEPHAADREYSMEMAMTGSGPGQPFKRLVRGQIVHGTVVQVNKDLVLVDVGTKSEGIIHLDELSNENLQSTEGVVSVGAPITAVVLHPENPEGNPVLSKRRADFQDAWDRIETALRDKVTIDANVVERVKGGLVVDVGVRGFVPATHVHDGKQRNIERFVGQSLPLKVLEIDRERRKVVLSNKLAQEELNEVKRVEVFEKIKPGMRLTGTISRILDYGAFVDLGGTDGLLHVSEMSWTRINHPSDVLKEGQEVEVAVLKVERERGKISLGRRQVLPDPWSLVAENYLPGQTISVPITRIVQNGAFAKLPEGVEGFIHVSEMSTRRIGRPSEVVAEGQRVDVKVLDVDPGQRRMGLSIKALIQHEERQEIQKHMPRQQQHQAGTTIGERLGGLKAWKVNEAIEDEDDVDVPLEDPADSSDAVATDFASAPEAVDIMPEVDAETPQPTATAEPIGSEEASPEPTVEAKTPVTIEEAVSAGAEQPQGDAETVESDSQENS